jgi:hypothetical protein
MPPEGRHFFRLVFSITNVSGFCGIKGQIANGSNQAVNSEGDHRKKNVGQCSGSKTFGLQGSEVDDKASNPTQEEGEKETNQLYVIHGNVLLSLCL